MTNINTKHETSLSSVNSLRLPVLSVFALYLSPIHSLSVRLRITAEFQKRK